MTGELTLRGRVLPIGGLKEKLIAAVRAGISKVFIPAENKRDLDELPAAVRSKLEIITVTSVEEVLRAALLPAAEPPAGTAGKTLRGCIPPSGE